MLGFNNDELKELGAINTATEICQQPKMWQQTYDIICNQSNNIELFLQKYLKKDTRILLTGAGSSDYVGQAIYLHLAKELKVRVEAIGTTDIVSNYTDFLEEDTPTILVSYARSGDSPESKATFNLCNKYIKNISHIVITCNENGELYKNIEKNKNSLAILMPKKCNDKGFAMTSSLTSMMLATVLLFDIKNIEKNKKNIEYIMNMSDKIIKNYKNIEKITENNFDRVVYLGSGMLKGVANELALKNLELTSGKMVSISESVLGFRHGPKSIINDNTIILMMCFNDEYIRLYDMDLISEINNDEGKHNMVVIDYKDDDNIRALCNNYINTDCSLEGVYLIFGYLVVGQIFALFNSIKEKVKPDAPRPNGTVNRVVKGVTIHREA